MRKKLILSISCVLLVCVLLASLTSCMKIGMKQNSIESRLKEVGASISYERTTPMTNGSKGYSFEDLILSEKSYTYTVDSQEVELTQQLYVIFCGDDESADFAESACKEYVSKYSTDYVADLVSPQDPESPKLYKWNVYRYDRVVMCGYYELLTIARND